MESGKETRLPRAPAAKKGEGSSELSPLAHLGSSNNKVVRICVESLRAGLQASRAGPCKAIAPQPKAEEKPAPFRGSRLWSQEPDCETEPGWNPLVEATLQALEEESEQGWDPLVEATLQALEQTPSPRTSVSAEDLLGCWLDSYGNTVVVQSMNAQLTQLTVTLSRNPRPDIYLSLWQTPGGDEWYCGEAKLDLDHLYNDSVTWIFPDGRRSVWVWQAFTLEALQTRGLAVPQDYSQPVDFVEVWVPVGVGC